MIELKNIFKSYEEGEDTFGHTKRFFALNNINLTIDKGFTLIYGQSGSGKSTLLHILGFLDTPDISAEIVTDDGRDPKYKSLDPLYSIDGTKVLDTYGSIKHNDYREKVGFVFQFSALNDNLTSLENVTLPLLIREVKKRERNKVGTELLIELGLKSKKSSLTSKLSGGERQRVAIARALCGNPDIILADEPTGSLDTDTSFKVLNTLITLCSKRDKYLIMVTHNEDFKKYADRIIELKDGFVISDTVNKREKIT